MAGVRQAAYWQEETSTASCPLVLVFRPISVSNLYLRKKSQSSWLHYLAGEYESRGGSQYQSDTIRKGSSCLVQICSCQLPHFIVVINFTTVAIHLQRNCQFRNLGLDAWDILINATHIMYLDVTQLPSTFTFKKKI